MHSEVEGGLLIIEGVTTVHINPGHSSRRLYKTVVTVDNNIEFDVLLSIVTDPVSHQAGIDT